MRFDELTDPLAIMDLIAHHNTHSEYVVLDSETTGLNPFTDKILAIVLSGSRDEEAVSIPGKHVSLFGELRCPIVAHNFKFDFKMFYQSGVDLRKAGLFADTMLLDHLLDENQEHSLDAIVKRRYNDSYKEEFWGKYKSYQEAPRDEQLEYECKDVIYTGRAYRDIKADLSQDGIPAKLADHVHALALALYNTEIEGIKLDLSYLQERGVALQGKITSLLAHMRESVSMEILKIENEAFCSVLDSYKTEKGRINAKRPVFNFDSSQQLGRLVYDELRLPVQVNKKRKRTCDDAALEKLEDLHPFIGSLREYRGHQKVYTSFIEGSLKQMHGGRIYPTFNVNGTVTGRISASAPNLQQLPTEGGIRGIYVPDDGQVLLARDYQQLEVTLAAHFSRDTNLLRIVYEGASQHDITAQGLGINRALAKTINFALQYGAGVKRIQAILSCSEKDAQYALDKYWETYSGLRAFIERCHASVDKGEPLVSPFGRRRRFPISEENGFWDRQRMKRQAANSLIQGTGGDLTSRSFYLVNKALHSAGIGKGLFTIHDELLISVVNNDTACQQAKEILTYNMELVGKEIGLTVPLTGQCSNPMLRWSKS